jgi:hypothetical protein
MTRTIDVADANFSFALGPDVGATTGQSRFSESAGTADRITGLTITSRAGDTNPYRFDPGEIYDLSMTFDGTAHAVAMTVTRSDVRSDGVSVIVFRGTDPYGQTFEIIFTPGTDIDAWYEAARASGSDALFYRNDQDAASTVTAPCFAADTSIETPGGPRPAGSFSADDRVLSLDGWDVPLRAVERFRVPGTGPGMAVSIPPGVLGATCQVRLSRQHRVLVRSPLAELWFATPEVLVPAVALVDAGLARADPRPVEDYVHLLCDRHEILFAGGLPVESLFLGAKTRDMLDAPAFAATGIAHRQTARPALNRGEAAALLARMHGRALVRRRNAA